MLSSIVTNSAYNKTNKEKTNLKYGWSVITFSDRFTSKPAEFYAKGIEGLPNTWQQVIVNHGEYIIVENVIVYYFLRIN